MSNDTYDSKDFQERVSGLLRAGRAGSFDPFFVDRVMKRISPSGGFREPSFYDALSWVFVRAAVAAVVLILVIGTLNAVQFGVGDVGSLVDALFGLPSNSLADMLTYDLI
jgi:hypothetical protein